MDRIADAIIRVRNAQMAKHETVRLLSSSLVFEMFEILKRLGYIKDSRKHNEDGKTFIDVVLKYDKNGEPVISEFKRVSKYSRRVYSSSKQIPRIANGYAATIISTSKGVMTGKEARDLGLGGEIVAYVL